MSFKFDKLSKKERTLCIKCIQKFFYDLLPTIQKISKSKRMQKIFGFDIASIGIEKAFELVLELFEDERLVLLEMDIDNFLVFVEDKDEMIVIYQMEKGKRII